MRPLPTESSGFRFYSFGIVAEDKEDDGDFIKVTPIEELPLIKGRLKEVEYKYTVSGVNHKDVKVKDDVKGVGFVVARWSSLDNGNRNTAPNVYEGETVMLLRFGNTDDVFWVDMFREPKLRRLEHVVHSFSNLKEKGEAYEKDSSHYVEISSREQRIQLHTSNNRDEPVGFDVTFDLAKGTFTFLDTNDNRVFIDSVKGELVVDMNKSITLNAPEIKFNGTTIESLAEATNTIKGSTVLINS